MQLAPIISYAIILVSFAGIAVGRIPGLAMNRAGIAVAGAAALIASGALGAQEAFAAVDFETIALLFCMMVLVANLRISGFFDLAGSKIVRIAHDPGAFLAVVILASGFLSALFLNDTICIMLTPLVAQIVRRRGMDGRPYLIGLAAAANAGSCATPIGNPQNMLIAASSGLGLRDFAAALALPSLFALGCTWVAVVLVFPSEFSRSRARLAAPGPAPVAGPGSGAETDIALMRKSLAAAGLLLVLLVFGVRTSLAALVAASALLVTRRIHPERVLREVDFTLLVFFSGLFVLTGAVGRSPLFARAMDAALPHLVRPGAAFAATVALASNLISNVPAVMLLSPVASGFADSRAAWFMLAMASTFAGNLTLLGSVANLIVAEQAERFGTRIGFADYLKVGVPVTLASIAGGVLWLGIIGGK